MMEMIFLFLLHLSSSITRIDAVDRFSYKEKSSVSPKKWDTVEAEENEWKKWRKLNTSKNECGSSSNKQSPINLTKKTKCEGRFDHRMYIDRGNCALHDIQFEITPYSLKGTYPKGCRRPSIDISNSFHDRYASTFELKVPSEHTIEGKQYDAELYVSHVDNVDGSKNRDNRISTVSVLLDASDDVNSN